MQIEPVLPVRPRKPTRKQMPLVHTLKPAHLHQHLGHLVEVGRLTLTVALPTRTPVKAACGVAPTAGNPIWTLGGQLPVWTAPFVSPAVHGSQAVH